MWFKNEAYERKDKYDKFVESLDYWEHLHLSMALYCLNHPDASNDEAYAECLVDGGPSLAYRLKAACHIENNSRDKANTDNKLKDMSSSTDIDTNTAQRTLQAIKVKMSTAVSIEKQPHVRIEFDDINDVPHVWIDGKQIAGTDVKNGLVSLHLDWKTDDGTTRRKNLAISWLMKDTLAIGAHKERFGQQGPGDGE